MEACFMCVQLIRLIQQKSHWYRNLIHALTYFLWETFWILCELMSLPYQTKMVIKNPFTCLIHTSVDKWDSVIEYSMYLKTYLRAWATYHCIVCTDIILTYK